MVHVLVNLILLGGMLTIVPIFDENELSIRVTILSVSHRVAFKFETWFDLFIMSKLCRITTEALKDIQLLTFVY